MLIDAISAYRTLLRQKPQDVDALLQIGRIFTQQNRPDEAVVLFRQVIAQHPLDYEASAHNGMGIIINEAK
jgi:cytochrome c-type biogenesis protein CcmH/NrfG